MQQHAINNADELESLLVRVHPVTSSHVGEILLEEGRISPEQLETALAEQRRTPTRHLGEVLVDLGFVARSQLNAALAEKLGIPYVKLDNFHITPEVLALVPPDVAMQHNVLPLAVRNNRLIVAMENPLDEKAFDVLRFKTNCSIETVLTGSQEISQALDKYYRQQSEADLTEMVEDAGLHFEQQPNEEQIRASADDIVKDAQRKPIVRLVDAIVMQGIRHHASDIHIRPDRDRVNILYRIDGRLRFSRSLHRSLLPPLVSRIKITGRMDIAERRLPQDGHARVHHDDNLIDLRISVIPTIHGESVVIRILDKSAGLKSIDNLGLGEQEFRTLRRAMTRNNGIILVTGPTGSGKSTTLYAVLDELKGRDPHIITVEDPVEYDMQGIEQIQVLSQAGYTFAEALRHILRHDPDVVMVGEIRDVETARIAIRAALTGHLVFSTLHTNDAATAISRLLDMGLEPYLLGATLLGVMAQRLVRLNCPHCMQEEKVDTELRQVLQVDPNEVFHKGAGCAECGFTGYKGRTAVAELLEITPALTVLINEGANTQAIKQTAIAQGMRPLTQNALAVARAGKTSLEEVFSVRLE